MKEEEKIQTYNHQNKEISKNYQLNVKEINTLIKLIKENKQILLSKINPIKEEIIHLKSKLSTLKLPDINVNKNLLEQNLIKQKLIAKTIIIYKEEFDSLKENINILEEEYNYCNVQLYNLISIKDNYEEIIKENSKYIFKNLMISYDQSTGQSLSYNNLIGEQSLCFIFNNNNDIDIKIFDINNIQNLSKFSNYIYKILSSHITSLNNENNIRNIIFSKIEEIYSGFIQNKYNVEKFVKKIAYNITISDDKIHNFIIIPRLEVLLKYIIKIFSIEKTINDYMQFINKDYIYNKDYFSKKFTEIKTTIQKFTKEKLEYNKQYQIQEKEYKENIKLENEIENIKKEIQEKEKKINIEQNKYLLIDIKYKNKIKKLENIHNNSKANEVQKTIEYVQKNINNLFNQINKGNNNNPKNVELNINNDSEDIVNTVELNIENKNIHLSCDCYISICNSSSNNIIFDPLNNYDIKPESKGFNKSLISLDKDNKVINIKLNYLKEETNIKIDTKLIVNIIILQNMKKIIYYMNKYQKEKNNNIQLLLNNKDENIDEIIKCIYNKYFCLSLVLSNNKIINFIFLTYNSFKTWLKIFDDFCKNKK